MRTRPRDLRAHLEEKLLAHPARCYVIGYSGGLDSTVLLHLAAGLKETFPFRALHIHHGLSPQADFWQEHCRKTCQALGLPFQATGVEVSPETGESLEAAARRARYRAFEEHLGEGEILLLAHHASDQSETVLFHLLRGGGPKGLSGIPETRPLGHGKLLRPFLEIPREELRLYASTHGLSWIEDEGNRDLRFDRNFLRQEVIPLLKRRWPQLEKTIARSASHLAESQALLDELADEWLREVEAEAHELDLQKLSSFPARRQRLMLRRWLERRMGLPPSTDQLERIFREVIGARTDRSPQLKIGRFILRRFRRRLLLETNNTLSRQEKTILWPKDRREIELPDGSRLSCLEAKEGISRRRWEAARVEIRYRQGGEVLRIPDRGRRPLKKWFLERGIPPWRRDAVPLIYLDGELAAVADMLVCEPFLAQNGEPALKLRWVVAL